MRSNPDAVSAEHTRARATRFEDFYRVEHEGQVRRAFLLVGRSDLAHEAVADAFTAVWERWERIDEPGPYLNRCVLNACRDLGRRAGREEPTDLLPEQSLGDDVDEMAALLVGLPFRQRSAIVLRFYGRCSEAEIAAALDCATGTVGSLIHRGLASLRREFDAADHDRRGDDS